MDRVSTPHLICPACQFSAAPLDWRCTQCGSPLELAGLPTFDPANIDSSNWSLWRYAAMLPVQPKYSLGEGTTPLLDVTLHGDGDSFHAKCDHLNPTGSYKDRGTTVLLNYFASHGVQQVVETSSGNAGASVALFSAMMGMQARIFTPAAAVGMKKAQIAKAAEVIAVEGPRREVDAATERAASEPGVAYATHAWNPYFIVGQMTLAWELWEQLGRRAPEAIACPVGMGCLMLGIYRGFVVLREAGLIERLPRIFAVQAAASDPIVRAWESGAEDVPQIETQKTVADGIVIAKPVRSQAILQAIRATQGAAFRVDESLILPMRDRLAKQHGLLVEPTSATTVAALPQIRQQYQGDDLVIVLTGNGLKTLHVG